jgi:hypothetical protein
MTTVRETKRAAQIAAIHGLADWLAEHPHVPMPTLSLHRHLHSGDGTDVENLAAVRSLAEQIGVGADEGLDDRTVLRYRVNEHVWYELFAWHKDGRGNLAELERLRARVAELEASVDRPAEPKPEPCDPARHVPAQLPDTRCFRCHAPGVVAAYEPEDPTGQLYTRVDDGAEDPTRPGVREPMHTGAVTDGGLVDETEDPFDAQNQAGRGVSW